MDRIMKAQKADVLTQFSEMKFNEGIISERKRIAEKLVSDYCCVPKYYEYCNNDCIPCWMEYLKPK